MRKAVSGRTVCHPEHVGVVNAVYSWSGSDDTVKLTVFRRMEG